MAEWRKDIKDYFKTKINLIVKQDTSKEFQKFDIWNSQVTQENQHDSIPRINVYFEYSAINQDTHFSRQENIQGVQLVPVDITLHIVARSFSKLETAQDEVFRLASLLVAEFNNIKIEDCTWKRMIRVREEQDINHKSLIEHQIVFGLIVVEDIPSKIQKTYVGDDPDVLPGVTVNVS